MFCIGGTKPHGTGGVWAWSEVRDSNINRNKEQPCTRKWGSREHDTFKTKRGNACLKKKVHHYFINSH